MRGSAQKEEVNVVKVVVTSLYCFDVGRACQYCNLISIERLKKSELIAHRVCNTLLYIQIQYIHTFMLIHRIRHKKIMKAKIHGVACMKFETKSTHKLIYFTTITKQVIQLILSMLVGTDVCVRMVFVWEETGVPGGKPTCLTW